MPCENALFLLCVCVEKSDMFFFWAISLAPSSTNFQNCWVKFGSVVKIYVTVRSLSWYIHLCIQKTSHTTHKKSIAGYFLVQNIQKRDLFFSNQCKSNECPFVWLDKKNNGCTCVFLWRSLSLYIVAKRLSETINVLDDFRFIDR